MGKISKQDFIDFLSNLSIDDNEFDQGNNEQSKEDNSGSDGKQESNGSNKLSDSEEELAKIKEELSRLKSEQERKQEEKKKAEELEKGREELNELNEKIRQQQDKAVESSVENQLAKKDFDSEAAQKILGFVKYDSLKTSDGDVDEEKVSNLVDVVTSLSLRNPPKGKKSQDLRTKNQGFAKYLNS